MNRIEACDPIYGTKVLFLLGGTAEAGLSAAKTWLAKCGQEIPTVSVMDCRGRSFRSENGHFVAWVKKPHDIITLFHEIIHIGVWAMTHIGMEVNDQTDEAMAYYCDWLARQALGKEQG